MSLNDKLWFVTHIDRDFLTNRYGNGPTLYTNLLSESMIKYDILKYTKIENGIKVETGCNQTIELKGSPSKKEFDKFYLQWEKWDNKYGAAMEDNRCDYKPIFYDSIESIIKDLNNEPIFYDIKNSVIKVITEN